MTNMITRIIAGKALMNNDYNELTQTYRTFGLGEPSELMIRFYKRNIKDLYEMIATKYDKSGQQGHNRISECLSLILIIEAILAHPDHVEVQEISISDIYTQLSEVV